MHAYIANRDDDRGMSLVLHLLAVAIVGHVARGRDTETKSEAALDSGPSSGWRIEQILKRTARSETCGVSRRGGPLLVVLGGSREQSNKVNKKNVRKVRAIYLDSPLVHYTSKYTATVSGMKLILAVPRA